VRRLAAAVGCSHVSTSCHQEFNKARPDIANKAAARVAVEVERGAAAAAAAAAKVAVAVERACSRASTILMMELK
jgi:hypothetical protein